jgi:single-strand DNA-binding protein
MPQKFECEGFVGRDPEMRFTPAGKAVCNFSLGVGDNRKQGDEWIKRTMWVRVTTWGDLAERCNKLIKKGMKISAHGKLTFDEATGNPRTYKKNDGTTSVSFEMVAFGIDFPEDVDSTDVGQEEIPF